MLQFSLTTNKVFFPEEALESRLQHPKILKSPQINLPFKASHSYDRAWYLCNHVTFPKLIHTSYLPTISPVLLQTANY